MNSPGDTPRYDRAFLRRCGGNSHYGPDGRRRGHFGLVLARVLDLKEVGDRTVAILDAGMHSALRPALVSGGHRLRVLATDERAGGDVIVAGPLCTGLDVFPERLERIPAVGDLVAILDLGAYGYSESMPLFLSHPVPAEVAVRGGQVECIRNGVAPAEALATQQIPTWDDVAHGGLKRWSRADDGAGRTP